MWRSECSPGAHIETQTGVGGAGFSIMSAAVHQVSRDGPGCHLSPPEGLRQWSEMQNMLLMYLVHGSENRYIYAVLESL